MTCITCGKTEVVGYRLIAADGTTSEHRTEAEAQTAQAEAGGGRIRAVRKVKRASTRGA